MEVAWMEFTITCPVDGSIEVGLEDVDVVVLRGSDRADITFVCPHCGTSITVGAIVPTFLLSAMQALAEMPGAEARDVVLVSSDPGEFREPDSLVEELKIEAYCEYFRRQLEGVVGVEGALAEMDSNLRR